MDAHQSKPSFRKNYVYDPMGGGGQILDPVAYFPPNQQPQTPHLFHVMGPTKRPKEEILDGPTSQVSSSLDFFKIGGAVSTGLGLAIDNPSSVSMNLASSSGSSSSGFSLLPPLPAVSDDGVERELLRIDAEMDNFIRLQGEQLRKSILENIQAKQFQTLASFEEKFRYKIQEKEIQIQDFTKRNMELEEQFRKLNYEVSMWQQQAKINEDMIVALRLKFQLVNNREGCGDSEVDSAPCSKTERALDFQLLHKENEKDLMTCKVCRANEMCMLLLPCRHLCLCKDCEAKLNFCPVCHSSKMFGVEVYM